LQALVPGSDPYIGNAQGFFNLAWWSRDYAKAIDVARFDAASDWSDAANIALPRELYLAWAFQASRDNDNASHAYAKVSNAIQAALAQSPDAAELHLALGFADAGLGDKDSALREGRRAVELMPVSRDVLSGSSILVWLAQIEVRVGEPDAAFDHLRQGLTAPSGGNISPALLKLDPVWDPLRKDPRFEKLANTPDGGTDHG
jgi:tetratricopeptide (TPR) repeat protein